ncbi:hypothetical protein K491DRAFT_618953 [Lophiostoma macrostomum CBS 122681]|uniref:Transcriptional regulator n=1 Tax=Lophiostoma macrostomum CBS 122681 TaxID=1314788 RepID=A0A6A6TP52_9PLEO|nr:hypothetical protein K491DRAFT_618953 [Lophiostoma macrostomum CBS 122681]
MSDSEAAGLPSDATISRALRDVVISTYKSGKTDDLTVKRVRTGAETQLELPEGFFKKHGTWNKKSKDIILEAVVSICRPAEPAPTPAPKKVSKPKAVPKAAPKKTKAANDSPHGVKRRAAAPEKKTQKRRKTVVSSDEESDTAPTPPKEETPSDIENESPPKKLVQRTKKVVTEDSEDEGVVGNGAARQAHVDEDPSPAATPPRQTKGDVSESELSSLIDESPVKKRQKKAAPVKGGKASTAKEVKLKAKPKGKAQDDPDQAEIKRLQGWLVKCGIRKVWSKELANYDTSKEKIRHLKDMLMDAGMDGKYSVEKAARIKEEREFAKDLEAIQEADQVWGAKETEGGGGRPKRRAAAKAATSYVLKRPAGDEDDDTEGGAEKDESSDGTDDMSEDTGESEGPSNDNDVDSD